ncbi:hypothetical protein ES706_05750 [subsurface metagenome]
MKKIGIMALVAVAVVAIAVTIFSVSASENGAEPIWKFEVIKDFPSTICAGSTYEARYRFGSTADKPILVVMRFGIDGPDIGLGEWSVEATMNGDSMEVTENLENAGTFTFGHRVGSNSTGDVTVRVSSLLNILPTQYTFTFEFWSEAAPPRWFVNEDNVVDLDDLILVAYHYGETELDPSWLPAADVDQDGSVGLLDLMVVAYHYGEEW